MDLSNWQLNGAVPAEAFASSSATGATHIEFARPDPTLPPGAKHPAKGKPSKTK
jgi:hypothetical protein